LAHAEGTAHTNSGRGGKPATVWSFRPRNSFTLEVLEKPATPARRARRSAATAEAVAESTGITKNDLNEFAQMIVQGVAQAVSMAGRQPENDAGGGEAVAAQEAAQEPAAAISANAAPSNEDKPRSKSSKK